MKDKQNCITLARKIGKKKSNRLIIKGSVSSEELQVVAGILYRKFHRERKQQTYAQVKEILTLLLKGGYLLSCFAAPGLARIAPDILKNTQPEWDNWKKYNKAYLARTLRRLIAEGMVSVRKDEMKASIRISKLGEQKVLQYALDNLEIPKTKTWDRKWRLIIYDVSSSKRYFQDLFRKTIKKLGLISLQKSVYITPFPCEKQIKFLKEYLGVKAEVLYMVVEKFENEKKYKKHFNL